MISEKMKAPKCLNMDTRAVKGSATIILDRTDYETKYSALLDEERYKELKLQIFRARKNIFLLFLTVRYQSCKVCPKFIKLIYKLAKLSARKKRLAYQKFFGPSDFVIQKLVFELILKSKKRLMLLNPNFTLKHCSGQFVYGKLKN